MSTEFSDYLPESLQVPQPDPPVPCDPVPAEVYVQVEPPHPTPIEPDPVAISSHEASCFPEVIASLPLPHADLFLAPAIGDRPAPVSFAPASQPLAAPVPSKASGNSARLTQFWIAAVGIGFVLLVAVSDWRSKDGPPIPFPSTSKIPQVR